MRTPSSACASSSSSSAIETALLCTTEVLASPEAEGNLEGSASAHFACLVAGSTRSVRI
jgi:hypothetical protein